MTSHTSPTFHLLSWINLLITRTSPSSLALFCGCPKLGTTQLSVLFSCAPQDKSKIEITSNQPVPVSVNCHFHLPSYSRPETWKSSWILSCPAPSTSPEPSTFTWGYLPHSPSDPAVFWNCNGRLYCCLFLTFSSFWVLPLPPQLYLQNENLRIAVFLKVS